MKFFASAIETLKGLVIALGAGPGVGALSTCWMVTATTTLGPMRMCDKVTYKNLIDSTLPFQYL